ncbi:MAG: DNA topoisomerase, partial [Clostridium sp.]|nr:DNA topoisomerase [Clostridium sp.]
RIVGDTMGKYHPHGDSSIYDSLVVMTQEFKKGLPLVDGHGNFGNIEGDGAAAMRYTEARLQKITQEAFLSDLDKDIVDFVPNFDETEREPAVLPVKIPNLLINGSEGIAVGMATNIPPHNLIEVIDAMKATMQKEDISTKELMKYIKGPDFPTGGIVVNQDDLLAIYESGSGKIRIRGKVEVEKAKGGRLNLVITQIPYPMIGANIARFLLEVAALSETKKTADILDISNQSSKEGIRIVIELRKDADVDNFTNLLYKKTRLEDTFGVNMLAIHDGRPETMGLKSILKACVDFQYEVNQRKYQNLLAKEMERREIQEGLIKACNVIDLIIEILRGSKDREMATKCLTDGITDGIKFKSRESKVMAAQLLFTPKQAQAILEMRFYRLIGLEIEALLQQHQETLANIYRYEDILAERESMAQVIIDELNAIKKEYGRKRRTVIINAEEAVYKEKEEEEFELIFLLDRFGYAKTIDKSTYERNKEAADGENSFVLYCMNTERICLFTDSGQLYTIKAQELPYVKLRDKGVPLDNISKFDSQKERILLAQKQSSLGQNRYLFVTRQAMMKVVDGGEFDVAKRAVAATKLEENDALVSIFPIGGSVLDILLVSKVGFVLRFPISEIPEKKKTAVGVRSMKLGNNDEVEAVYYPGLSDATTFPYGDDERSFSQVKSTKRDQKGKKLSQLSFL